MPINTSNICSILYKFPTAVLVEFKSLVVGVVHRQRSKVANHRTQERNSGTEEHLCCKAVLIATTLLTCQFLDSIPYPCAQRCGDTKASDLNSKMKTNQGSSGYPISDKPIKNGSTTWIISHHVLTMEHVCIYYIRIFKYMCINVYM